MEPSTVVPPDKEGDKLVLHHPPHLLQLQPYVGPVTSHLNAITTSTTVSTTTVQQGIEKLSRPMAFDKMEALVREMQDAESGVPVRSQKLFLTSIPSAFMGYDLIEWLMERLGVEESEALNLSNQLCQHGYFFPVSDSKTLVVKDDSSLYRFQTPYYWPWQQKAPDNIDYAIYLAKRSLRNKQRHGLEDYEAEALSSLHKNLKGKWDFITMQAEEQVRLAKERKKGDKIVGDSQERAFWRVHRPPPGQFTPLEPCPIPSRDRQGKPRRRTSDDLQREIAIVKTSLGRNRVKMSQACESLCLYYETFAEYDPLMQPALPSNPWVTEDVTFWQLNSSVVEVPTEKRVKRWSISIEELVSDPTGLQEFTLYLKKEYSHENIRFWMAVNDLRRSSHSQISKKVKEIFEEFLAPGAPCEINIDGKTMEKVLQGLKNPSRFAFDSAAEHVFALLLKKDCYPRFVRSEHYKNLLANAVQPSHKKRFFGFGGAKKKGSTATPNPSILNQVTAANAPGATGSLQRRRGSDRSLSGSAHELAVSGVKDATKVPHSHSQSNLNDIPYREPLRNIGAALEVTMESSSVCPWDTPESEIEIPVTLNVCPWEGGESSKQQVPKSKSNIESGSSSSDISEVSERMKRSCGLRQNTLDGDFHSTKRLGPIVTEQRRASMTMAPRLSEQFSYRQPTPQPTMSTSNILGTSFEEKSSSQNSLSAGNGNGNANPSASGGHTTVKMKIGSFEENEEDELNPKTNSDENSSKSNENNNNNNDGKTLTNIISNNNNNNNNNDNNDEVKENVDNDNVLVDNKDIKIQHNNIVKKCESKLVKSSAVDHDHIMMPHPSSMPTISVCYASAIETEKVAPVPTKEIVQEKLEKVEPIKIVQQPDVSSVKKQGSEELQKEQISIDEHEEEIVMVMEGNSKQSMTNLEKVETSSLPEDDNFCETILTRKKSNEHEEDYEMVMEGESLAPGCVPPAPTPAPSIAPLAEVEMDPADDDLDVDYPPPASTSDEQAKKKKKKEKKEREAVKVQKSEEESEKKTGNPVCPWDDEDESAADDAPYVKTYSTLGYL